MIDAYLIILIAPCMVLAHPHDEVQDGYKCTNRIRVASEHYVAESNVVKCGDMTCGYAGEW